MALLPLLLTALSLGEIVPAAPCGCGVRVFFKITKSFLNFTKSFQEQSDNGLVAQTAVVCRNGALALAREDRKGPGIL
jgi:hypothetical protein